MWNEEASDELKQQANLSEYTRCFDDEDYYNPDTDTMNWRGFSVHCPYCDRVYNPMYSKYTYRVDSGWVWVGDSHKEPYAHFVTKCRKCNTLFTFRMQAGQ